MVSHNFSVNKQLDTEVTLRLAEFTNGTFLYIIEANIQ